MPIKMGRCYIHCLKILSSPPYFLPKDSHHHTKISKITLTLTHPDIKEELNHHHNFKKFLPLSVFPLHELPIQGITSVSNKGSAFDLSSPIRQRNLDPQFRSSLVETLILYSSASFGWRKRGDLLISALHLWQVSNK